MSADAADAAADADADADAAAERRLNHSIPRTYFVRGIQQSTYKIWKQSDKDFLSYRENDEVSADAADAAADADADADAAAERRLNHSIPRTYFVRGIQ